MILLYIKHEQHSSIRPGLVRFTRLNHICLYVLHIAQKPQEKYLRIICRRLDKSHNRIDLIATQQTAGYTGAVTINYFQLTAV